MATEFILWLATAGLATLFLLVMMRRRQTALVGLLNDYVQRQAQWARRRAKAEAIIAEEAKTAADALSALAGALAAQETSTNTDDALSTGGLSAVAAQSL